MGLQLGGDAARIDTDLLQDRRHGAIRLLEQSQQEMFRRDLLLLGLLGKRLRLLDGFLGLLGQPVRSERHAVGVPGSE